MGGAKRLQNLLLNRCASGHLFIHLFEGDEVHRVRHIRLISDNDVEEKQPVIALAFVKISFLSTENAGIFLYFCRLFRYNPIDLSNTDRKQIHSFMMTCEECYSDRSRITPLLNPSDCLTHHTQYICGTCGRCICIERDAKRGLQRWNFPFGSAEIARLYLRTADYTMKRPCGIYEIKDGRGRRLYKIFADRDDLEAYLKRNKGKSCDDMRPLFRMEEYREFADTQVRKLSAHEARQYLSER